MGNNKQKRALISHKKVEEILSSTLNWEKTAYHGDVVIINIDKAAKKIVKYFEPRLKKELNDKIVSPCFFMDKTSLD